MALAPADEYYSYPLTLGYYVLIESKLRTCLNRFSIINCPLYECGIVNWFTFNWDWIFRISIPYAICWMVIYSVTLYSYNNHLRYVGCLSSTREKTYCIIHFPIYSLWLYRYHWFSTIQMNVFEKSTQSNIRGICWILRKVFYYYSHKCVLFFVFNFSICSRYSRIIGELVTNIKFHGAQANRIKSIHFFMRKITSKLSWSYQNSW